MAFNSFGASQSSLGNQNVLLDSDEPEEVETEHFGFLALKGDSKLKLFSEPFPKDSLPVPSAQLLAVASRKGVFAAVGPTSFIFGTTQSIRDAFKSGDADLIDYTPTRTFPLPSKVSHVAFDTAEEHLIVGAEAGGVAVYSLKDVMNSSGSQPAPVLELSLGGELREVRPNPAVELSQYVAINTANGDLRMLDLEAKGFVNNGVLATNISTICWSQRGKQIICGRFDGTCVQITPTGEEKASIPCVPGLDNCFVSSILWIDNNLFSLVHTPKPSDPNTPTTESVFHLYTRPPSVETPVFQKMPDPTPPFGMTRQSYHYGLRLFPWKPSLRDMFIYCSTSSTDIGMMLRMSVEIGEVPAGGIRVNTIANDTRRAEVPMDADYNATTAVGITLDFSSKDVIARPVVGSDIDQCGAQPILMLLNNEGILCAWHIIYSDAIKENEVYPGMATAVAAPAAQPAPAATSSFGGSAFGASTGSAFGQVASGGAGFGAKPAFGQSSFGQPAFGQSSFGSAAASSQPAFGQSGFGAAASTPTKPAFGQPAFGQSGFGAAASSAAKPAFGQSGFGAAAAKPAFGQSSFGAPAFGQSSFGQPSTPTKGFGAPSDAPTPAPSGGGFSKFASGSTGFGAVTEKASEKPVWAQGGTTSTPFGGAAAGSTFGSLSSSGPSPFGAASADGFKLKSSFAADNKEPTKPETKDTGAFGGFGSAFGNALSSAGNKPSGLDDDMDTNKSSITSPGSDMALSTPAVQTDSKPNPFSKSAFGSSTSGPSPFASVGQNGASPFGGSAFGQKSAFGQASTSSSTSVFGAPSGGKAESPFASKTTPAFGAPAPTSAFGSATKETTSAFASLNKNSLFSSPTTSTTSAFGQPSVKKDDAPLPPNPFATMKKAEAPPVDVPGDAPLPPNPFAKMKKAEAPPVDVPLPPNPFAKMKKAEAPPSDVPLSPEPEKKIGDIPLPPDPSAKKPKPKSAFEAPLPPDTSSRETFEAGLSSNSVSPENSPATPKKAAPKKATSKTEEGGSIFGSKATYQDTLKGEVKNPFANLKVEQPDEDEEDEEDESDEEDYEPRVSRGKAGPSSRAQPRKSLSSTPNRMGRSSPMKARSSLTGKPTFQSPLRRQVQEESEPEEEEDEDGEGEDSDGEGYDSEQYEDADASGFQGFPDEQPTEDEEESEEEEEEPEIIYQDDVERDELEHSPIVPIYEPPELSLDVGQAGPMPQNADAILIMDKLYERTNILLNKIGSTAKTMESYIQGASSSSLSPPTHLPTLDDIDTFEAWSMADLQTFTRLVTSHLSTPLGTIISNTNSDPPLDTTLEHLSNALIKTHQKVAPLPTLIDPLSGAPSDLSASAPLSPDTSLLRHNIRTKLNDATSLLDRCSRDLSTLQAALISSSSPSPSRKPPTVEAVRNTIRKLTHIILEKRSLVDSLERDLIRLKITGEARNAAGSNHRVSRRGVTREQSMMGMISEELENVTLGESTIDLKMSMVREEVEEKVGEWRGWGVRRRDRGKLLAKACEGRGVGVRTVEV